MATVSASFSSAQSITITLTSLGDGSWRQSAAYDNTSNLYVDALIGGSLQVGTSPTANQTIDIYAYGSYDGTNYTAGASGSDAAYTADGEELLLPVVQIITVDATSDQDYVWGPVSLAAVFGGILPSKFGIIVENNSGATTNATGTNNEVQFLGIKYTVA